MDVDILNGAGSPAKDQTDQQCCFKHANEILLDI